MNAARIFREPIKLMRQYRLGIQLDSEQGDRSIVRSAARIMHARLKYDVGPFYYSLCRFWDVPEREWSEYSTDDGSFKRSLRQASSPAARRIADNKVRFYEHCIDNRLPAIPVVCVMTDDDEFVSPLTPNVRRLDEWLSAIESAPDEMFVKPVEGKYGVGVFPIERTGSGFRFDGTSGSAIDLFNFLRSQLRQHKGLLLQPRLRSTSALSPIATPYSLCTVRALTCMRSGSAEFLMANLKIIVGDNISDNFAKGTSGNLLAAIDGDTGVLSRAWGSTKKDWPVITAFQRHPDTGHEIEGFRLPFWGELVDLAIRAQSSLPELRSAGWDIAATDQGLMLVEANVRFDLSILQIAHQRGLKKEFAWVMSS